MSGTSARPKALSPLLRSAIEVLEHGLWHFFRSDTPTDMKFALMHVDQAIELLLKERVRAGGKSIHVPKSSDTISMWRAYEIIENDFGSSIPERPDLELLHAERNNIQHKAANPSSEDISFLIEKAMGFIVRFTKDELSVNIGDHLPSVYLDQLFPKK